MCGRHASPTGSVLVAQYPSQVLGGETAVLEKTGLPGPLLEIAGPAGPESLAPNLFGKIAPVDSGVGESALDDPGVHAFLFQLDTDPDRPLAAAGAVYGAEAR